MPYNGLVFPGSDVGPNDATPIGAAAHFDCVNDPSPDGDATVLRASAALDSEAFGFVDAQVDAIPNRNAFSNVRLYATFSAQGGSGSATFRMGFRIGGVDYYGALHSKTFGSDYAEFTDDFAINPAHALREAKFWTREELRAAAMRFEFTSTAGGLPRAQLTQFAAQVFTNEQTLDEAIVDMITAQVRKVATIRGIGTQFKALGELTEFPCAYTVPVEGVSERMPTRSMEGNLSITLACAVKGDDPWKEFQALRKAIEEQIADDPSLDQLAFDAWVNSWNFEKVPRSVGDVVGVGDLEVLVHRRYTRGAP